MPPSVGIVMRTKDRPVLLRRALQSVFEQSWTHWKLVVVNDGGDANAVDDLVAAMRRAGDAVHVVHNATSLGMQGASAVGLAHLETEFLIVHDDDDSWTPAFLEIVVTELLRVRTTFPQTRGITAYANVVHERVCGPVVEIDAVEPFNGWLPAGFLSLDRLLAGNVLPPISLLFERAAFVEIGGLYEAIPYLGDWDFLIRFLRAFDVLVVPQFLVFYHWRAPSTSAGAYGNSITAEVDRHHFYRQLLLNRWLREDFAAGTFGAGSYANLRAHLPVADRP